MNNRIILTGKIGFEPEDKTKKHKHQASWKKTAFVMIGDDLCQYYSWFLKKRFGLILNIPLRLSHISFINDSVRDLTLNGKRSLKDTEVIWNEVKKKYNGKTIKIVLDLEPRTNGTHWWLNIPHDERGEIQSIRDELGLKKPYFGLHMSIGYANEKNIEHSQYIHELIKKGFIQ